MRKLMLIVAVICSVCWLSNVEGSVSKTKIRSMGCSGSTKARIRGSYFGSVRASCGSAARRSMRSVRIRSGCPNGRCPL